MSNKLIDLIGTIVDKRIGELTITKEPAKVISVDSGYKRAVVEFLNGSRFALLNKTGEKLAVGDSVWVEYRTLPASGYIATRNGEADLIGGGGGLILANGVVISTDQSGVYAAEIQETQPINVRNLERTYYGQAGDPIIAQQNAATTSKQTSSTTIDGWSVTDFSATNYLSIMTNRLIIDGHEFRWYLDHATDYAQENYTQVSHLIKIDGTTTMRTGNGVNSLTGRIPYLQRGSPMFIVTYQQIDSPGSAIYGRIRISVKGYLLINDYSYLSCSVYRIDNTEPVAFDYINFGTEAEYNYAVALTKHSSLPPSLQE